MRIRTDSSRSIEILTHLEQLFPLVWTFKLLVVEGGRDIKELLKLQENNNSLT
jgi:hypothetical protein